jgi:hypothetical protein
MMGSGGRRTDDRDPWFDHSDRQGCGNLEDGVVIVSLRERAGKAWGIICGSLLAAAIVAIVARMVYWNLVYALAGLHMLTGWLLKMLGIKIE